MSGPQFIHVEGYARKATKGKTTTAAGAIGEALREEGYISHLEKPTPPKFIHGSAEGLAELNTEIHDQAEKAKDALGRKMRADQTILLAGVASFPKPTVGLTEADKAEMEEWIKATNTFLYKEFKSNFKVALLHLDEEYPHIHFYVADTKDPLHTKDLHPAGITKDKKNRAASLRGFQDRYSEQVGVKFGMTRLGPKRERLSREDWLEKKRQAKELAKKLKELTALEAKAQAAEAKAEVAISEAEAAKIEAMMERAQYKEAKQQVQKQIDVLTHAAERFNNAEDKLRELGVKVPRRSIEIQAAEKLVESLKPQNQPRPEESKAGETNTAFRPKP